MKFSHVFLVVVCMAPHSLWAAYICTGKLDDLRITYAGTIVIISQEIYGDGSGRAVCSVVTDYKDVISESCKTWLTVMLSANAAAKAIQLQYRDEFSCSTEPTWGDGTKPYWIGIQ